MFTASYIKLPSRHLRIRWDRAQLIPPMRLVSIIAAGKVGVKVNDSRLWLVEWPETSNIDELAPPVLDVCEELRGSELLNLILCERLIEVGHSKGEEIGDPHAG